MTNEVFSEHIKHIKNHSMDVLIEKNSNYSKGDTDALHNFVAGAAIAGCTPAQAAWGYATKHLVALRDKIQRNDFRNLADLEEKCCDIINYVAIIYAIGVEEECKRAEREHENPPCGYGNLSNCAPGTGGLGGSGNVVIPKWGEQTERKE